MRVSNFGTLHHRANPEIRTNFVTRNKRPWPQTKKASSHTYHCTLILRTRGCSMLSLSTKRENTPARPLVGLAHVSVFLGVAHLCPFGAVPAFHSTFLSLVSEYSSVTCVKSAGETTPNLLRVQLSLTGVPSRIARHVELLRQSLLFRDKRSASCGRNFGTLDFKILIYEVS